jgi:type IV pilus assembly protein PilE
MKRSAKGFTLVELMVTVAVLGILATIGYSIYGQVLQKGRRGDARQVLMLIAKAQEEHMRMFNEYATTSDQLNYGPDGVDNDINDRDAYDEVVTAIDHDEDGTPDYYAISITTDEDDTTQDFVVTATAISTQLNDTDCLTLTINQLGVKSAVDADANDTTDRCWP